ncbi:GIY-YIG nuclease family protein [Daejeonella sp.]|uniref:GIY-YIG nuclease family protein n=1 Tax=Daejeonella sp. TaxID=2805397 RepID=UPI003C7718FC
MKDHSYFIYILTNKTKRVLYTGVTNNLERRVLEHKAKFNAGFTFKYNCSHLIYYEEYQWIEEAIAREKQIKGGSRQKKIDLINAFNPLWDDLSEDWYSKEEIEDFLLGFKLYKP